MVSMKSHVREALLTAALFGSISPAFGQTPPAKQAPAPAPGPAVLVDGKLNVPNAPTNTSTWPSKSSADNARLDKLPTMARGPALTDAQRKLILEHVKSAGTAAPAPSYAGLTTQLPATAAMQPWPSDVVSQVPSLRGTKYVIIPGKVLLVHPDNAIVVGEIDR